MNRQVCAWHNRATSPGDFYLIRMYEDGTITAERKVNGVYTGEVELAAEAAGLGLYDAAITAAGVA